MTKDRLEHTVLYIFLCFIRDLLEKFYNDHIARIFVEGLAVGSNQATFVC
jgi:hypothetical protein